MYFRIYYREWTLFHLCPDLGFGRSVGKKDGRVNLNFILRLSSENLNGNEYNIVVGFVPVGTTGTG